MSTKPAPPAQAAAKPVRPAVDETTLEIGGGALALLALGGGAVALARRRRRHEEEEIYEDAYEPETAVAEPEPAPERAAIHDVQPAVVAPSAFSWGNEQPAANADDDGSDRRPGETWVERAYRGPSPANPSVSLRARLKRAAFFDKRERDVKAGKAQPVDTGAGLPETMVEEQERELA